jgi:thiol-disulfide isomerase/thioredoxin
MRKKIYILLITLLIVSCKDNTNNITKSHNQIEKFNIEKPKTIEKSFKFKLKSLNGKTTLIEVKRNRYNFKNIDKKIVMIYLFATWCPPCIGEIPHLNSLLKKYPNQIDILGVLLYDNDLTPKELKQFIKYHKINFFISNNFYENRKFANFIAPKLKLKRDFSIPIMVIFVDGKYFTHYEGSIPEEMIESDIKQAIIKLRGE